MTMSITEDIKSKTTVHVGLDLSLKGTGLTFYIENELENIKKFKFYILLYEKSSTIAYMNVNQIQLKIPSMIQNIDLNHAEDLIYNNSTKFTQGQMDHTKIFITVCGMIIKKIKETINEITTDYSSVNLYLNMEGSLLSGYDFNSQVSLNMLQGLLRGDLIKLHLMNNFNQLKFRVVPATALKLFFANYGKADKTEMMESFINNYNGKKLLPQANTDKKTVERLNDIIDGFALIAYNIYDLKCTTDKLLFNKTVIKPKKPRTRTKVARTKLSNSISKNLPKTTEDFMDNIDSEILRKNKIIITEYL